VEPSAVGSAPRKFAKNLTGLIFFRRNAAAPGGECTGCAATPLFSDYPKKRVKIHTQSPLEAENTVGAKGLEPPTSSM
jgi:hypothetical protein